VETFDDLINRSRTPKRQSISSAGWPPGLEPGYRLPIPGVGKIRLPQDLQGNPLLAKFHVNDGLLVCQPGFIVPMRLESNELVSLGIDPVSFRSEKPRRLGLAVVVDQADGRQFGVATALFIENGIRMGSTQLVDFSSKWTTDFSEAEAAIVDLLPHADEIVQPRPEPNSKPWRTLVALIGGGGGGGGGGVTPELPDDWRRQLELVAGLRRVRLDIRTNPTSVTKKVIIDLKANPPDGLLIWAPWVPQPQVFIDPYSSAKPGGYVDVLGSSATFDFRETLTELSWHLKTVSPLSQEPGADQDWSWEATAERIVALQGGHFRLTARAISMLEKNPYPKPRRMFEHLQILSIMASSYNRMNGAIGTSLEIYARDNHGIDISLFDKNYSGGFSYEGVQYDAKPHVKVDDHKSPSEVGRIYFAVDSGSHRFIVDHVGLHDYF
jgi:hypothetical protein